MTREAARVRTVLRTLKSLFPKPRIALRFSSAWELLVATVLSAQTTDEVVNRVTRKLFSAYPSVAACARAQSARLAGLIRPVNYHKTKARHLIAAARLILRQYKGTVPRTVQELIALPGVGRKTANVVTQGAFRKTEGIVVDTHVMRLARLWGLARSRDAVSIERELMQKIPACEWGMFPLRAIAYGRRYCPARNHNHEACPVSRALRQKARA